MMISTITRKEFREKYSNRVNGFYRSAIFGNKGALLKEIMITGYPVYLDTHYYGSPEDTDTFNLKTMDDIPDLKGWRDCHYFSLYENPETGERAWYMTGGRYD